MLDLSANKTKQNLFAIFGKDIWRKGKRAVKSVENSKIAAHHLSNINAIFTPFPFWSCI